MLRHNVCNSLKCIYSVQAYYPRCTIKGNILVNIDQGTSSNKGQALIPQAKLPFSLEPTQKLKKASNGYVVVGSNLKPHDKASEFGYMLCPICHKKGFRNDHFKHFHKEFMDKVVSKRKEKSSDSTPENPTVNMATKSDLEELGKQLVASISEAIK